MLSQGRNQSFVPFLWLPSQFLRLLGVWKVLTWVSGLRILLFLSFIMTLLTVFLRYKKSPWSILIYNICMFFFPGMCKAYKLDCKCKSDLLLLSAIWDFLILLVFFFALHMRILVCYMLQFLLHLLWEPSVCQTNFACSYGNIFP